MFTDYRNTNNKKPRYKVCVKCLTYNHVSYIEDTLNGFCNQKTSFPYVCVIIDDSSTDGEQLRIKKYLKDHFRVEDSEIAYSKETVDYYLQFCQHVDNLNCYFAVLLLHYNHFPNKSKTPYIMDWLNSSEYYATCEGDDYWVDPLKLEKQVTALDNNPQASLVHTGFYTVDKNNKEINATFYDSFMKRSSSGKVFSSLIEKQHVMAATCMFKPFILNTSLYKNSKILLDYHLYLTAAVYGDFIYLPEKTSCYRIHGASLCRSQSSFISKTISSIRSYYYESILSNKYVELKKYNTIKIKIDAACSAIISYYYGEKIFLKHFIMSKYFFYLLPALLKLILNKFIK